MDIRVLQALYERTGQTEAAEVLRDAFSAKQAERGSVAPKMLFMRLYDGRTINARYAP